MAAENPVESLKDEATCSICLDYFEDPVSIRCGHNFCRACISQYWRKSDINFSCPQCRKIVQHRNFKPNRVLANVVEIAKQLSLQTAKDSGGERECEKHQEALKLFFEEDENLIYSICRDSWDHRAHTVVPIEEAAQNYKVRNLYKLQRGSYCTEQRYKQTETQRQKIVSEFQQVLQLVEEKQRLLLAQLDEINKDILKRQKNYIAKITEEISRLDHLISELERKCQQPASEFLQLGQILSLARSTPPPGLRSASDTLIFSLILSPENVTLDPDTGNPWLIMSEDQKVEDLSFLPALGCEAFTTGRHYWEVELKEGGNVRLGVARESVKRMGKVSLKPKAGVWAIEHPRKIGVYLDYEGGQVTFYDADTNALIFAFPPASFTGQRICPIFFLFGVNSQLRLCP
uniref:Uncharacterized protein n=1 Tax=Gopherus evgoodei TaxID=1825980 RepID=A0A8C4WBB7_9SAUR